MTLSECPTYEEMILEKLIYFSIFSHPLDLDEIHNLLRGKVGRNEIGSFLKYGEQMGWLYSSDGYYSLVPEVGEWLSARRKKEAIGQQYFRALPFWSRLIRCFPFVRGVAVSGSLSKGVIHEDGDIDYFIITSAGRLWTTRTLLVLFKKIFLLNNRKFFCVNYFISEDHLEIPDRNVFTATEIQFLIPIYNGEIMEEFKKQNSWTTDYFGEFKHPIQWMPIPRKGRRIKRYMERWIDFLWGDKMDDLFMRLTLSRWRRKFSHFDRVSFDLALRTRKEVSKHHPQNFQKKVLSEMDRVRIDFERRRVKVAV